MAVTVPLATEIVPSGVALLLAARFSAVASLVIVPALPRTVNAPAASLLFPFVENVVVSVVRSDAIVPRFVVSFELSDWIVASLVAIDASFVWIVWFRLSKAARAESMLDCEALELISDATVFAAVASCICAVATSFASETLFDFADEISLVSCVSCDTRLLTASSVASFALYLLKPLSVFSAVVTLPFASDALVLIVAA